MCVDYTTCELFTLSLFLSLLFLSQLGELVDTFTGQSYNHRESSIKAEIEWTHNNMNERLMFHQKEDNIAEVVQTHSKTRLILELFEAESNKLNQFAYGLLILLNGKISGIWHGHQVHQTSLAHIFWHLTLITFGHILLTYL